MKFARMQYLYAHPRAIFIRPRLPVLAAVFLLICSAGCGDRPTTIDPTPHRPHAGVTLTLAATDPGDRDLLRRLARSWAARSGAEVQVSEEPWNGNADIGLIRPAEVARWADPGQLLDVPAAIKDSSHPYVWDDLLPVYANRLLTWGDRAVAMPVVAEGMVLAYRKDAFDGKDGRPVDPPGTWEELLETARILGPNSLPPLPADPERLAAEFFAAAASYDRQAVGRLSPGDLIREEFFAFQFDPTTGAPRLDAPAFRHVAGLFQQLTAFRGSSADASAAFQSGQARVGVVSLAELGRMGPDVAEQLAVAPIPGARVVFDADGNRRPTGQGAVNRVPYVGWGGRVGVVSTKCAAPAAAWDFLADVGMPDRTALELLADARLGAGPYRTSQLETRFRSRWYAYGLTADQVDRLANALRDNLGPGVQNYRLRLRTPNQHELAAAFDAELRTFLKSPKADPAAAMGQANRRWSEIIGREPPEQWRRQARRSLGY